MDIWKYVSLWILLHICPDINACPANSTSKYARVGETIRLQFKVDVNFKQFVVYEIVTSNRVKALGIAYFNGAIFGSFYLDNSLNFVGNLTTGNLSVEISKVKLENGNVYSMNRDAESISCISLYVLGIPKTTTIQNDNKIYSVGNNVTLTCISHSTTNPSDPKLNLQYNWKVNNVVNPTDARYIYSQFKQTLIVTKLVKEDANRNFTCTATEYGPTITGLTSASSDGHTINIIYGPDRCNINVQSPYILAEGNTPATITCQSDCFPSCSYKWTNSSTGKVVGFEGEFQLDTLTRYEAGNYTCSCQNTAIIDHRDTTSLQVIVNFASFFTEEHKGQTKVTVSENETDVHFKCEIDSYAGSKVQIMFQDVLLKETSQSSSLTFTRSSITCSHAGVYTCRGDNQQSQSPSSSINLFVRCSPRPLHQIKKNKTSSLYVPTTLTFTTIAYPVPGPTGFLWHKENGLLWMPLLSSNDLLVSSSGSQSHLTILNVSQSDYGRYKVTATNDVGSYVQYLFLLREDIQRQTYTTETCAVETNKTGTILGICFGILSAGLLVYASYLTILHKRRSTEKGKQKTEDLNTQVAYINVAEEGTVVEINASSENKDSEKVYTELSQYSKDDKSTYDVIQKN